MKEKNDLVEELKEIVNENKESNYEFTSIISHQRQDIESLRKLLEDNNIEVNISNLNLRSQDFSTFLRLRKTVLTPILKPTVLNRILAEGDILLTPLMRFCTSLIIH